MSWLVASTQCEAGVSTIIGVTSESPLPLFCSPLLSILRVLVQPVCLSCSSLVSQFWLTQVNICACHYIVCWYWHTSMVIFTGKNKRVGKQLASQKILQLLHPHVKNWGSLLRMYGRENSKLVKQVSRLLLECNLPCDWSFAFGLFWICKLSYNKTLRSLDFTDSNNRVSLISPTSKLKNLFS